MAFPDSKVKAYDFPRLCERAQREIENAVSGNVEVTADVKMCCAELVNYEATAELNGEAVAGVNSESVGDYSVSYASAGERRATAKATKQDIIRFWLGKSGISYRGVGRSVL